LRRKAEEERQRKIDDANRKKEELRLKREEEKRKIQETVQRQKQEMDDHHSSNQLETENKRKEILRVQEEKKQQLLQMQSNLSRQREEVWKKLEEEKEALQRRKDYDKEIKDRETTQQQTRRKRVVAPKIEQRREPRDVPILNYDDNLPFQPENELDNIVIQEYRNRTVQNPDLPNVPFTKGKQEGFYIIGQRRFNVLYEDGEVVVNFGNKHINFLSFIEKQEKVEGLKKKALNSAGGLLNLV